MEQPVHRDQEKAVTPINTAVKFSFLLTFTFL